MLSDEEYRLRLGARINRLRAEQGITRVEIADHCGVSHAAVGQWENGQTTPMASKRQKLSELLEATFDDASIAAEPLPETRGDLRRGPKAMHPTTASSASKAARLKQARERAGYSSASEAALALGASYSSYAGHESGLRGFRRSEVERYAEMFGVDPAWLEFGTGGGSNGAPRKQAAPPTGGTLFDRMRREQSELRDRIEALKVELSTAENDLVALDAAVEQMGAARSA